MWEQGWREEQAQKNVRDPHPHLFTTGGPNRILALIRNSKSSQWCALRDSSLFVSVSAVWPQLGRHPGPGHLSLAASLFHPWSVPCASTVLVRLSGGFNSSQGCDRLSSSRFRHTGSHCQTLCQKRPAVNGRASV